MTPEYDPGTQNKQTLAFVALHAPTPHCWHTLAGTFEYVPEEHAVQDEFWLPPAIVPGKHRMQTLALVALHEPRLHRKHTLAERFEYVPATQAIHDELWLIPE